MPSDEQIEILDLRNQPEKVAALVKEKNYFPGYHMNKKYWLTICLDGTVPFKEIKLLIDESYQLALK
ncbi:MmcQ/YjbR family DNA-binding protein [Enterococcus avium]|uniref:MmcQ/YjbR family DNA-binding protein n=1 Tax=Enterococcus avium TaxID=33945 RepID=UPI001F03851E|nr:MmcQ/YjbR family DNA-binding protein [Enterococcus avium]